MFKQNLKAVLNIQRPDKNGKYPLRIRATVHRKVTYYPTGIMLLKEQWNGEIVKHDNKALLNTALRAIFNELEKKLLEFSITGEQVIKTKKNLVLTFNAYATEKINNWTGSYGKGTIAHRWSYLTRFNAFRPGIKIKDINKEVLTKFENFCKDQGNANNTICSYTKFVKTICNAAVEDGILSASPLKGFKGVKYVNPLRETLSESEIKKIEKFANNKKNSPKLLNVANWFLFSCYCGLRYGDLTNFVGFKNGKVLLQTEKTKEVVSIFATAQIIEAKKRITKEIYSNQKCNDYLKSIADIVGIDKKITMHIARHTFCVQFLEKGGRLEILSKIIGHSSIKTTQIYAKISTKLADAEMERVWRK